MSISRNKIKKTTKDLLIGTWASKDIFQSDVEYAISRHGKAYKVRAFDCEDNEQGDVQEIKWNKREGVLSFSVYWNSTGRFARCKMVLLAADQIGFTFTYTDQESLFRKSEKRGKCRSH